MGQISNVAHMILSGKYVPELSSEIVRATSIYSESFSMRFYVHSSLFRNVIMMLGDEEQQRQWIEQVDTFRIFGCFAMVRPKAQVRQQLI